ncbi:MAG: DUF1549 domain-containing protein, partial [Akkermansiaceae bacterium]|nr:DUF1549 domain-containing protein [Akkermansiaceae bacterium]
MQPLDAGVGVPALEATAFASSPRNEIDHFIFPRLLSADLQPSPPASPRVLVRRLFNDLLGLPPTPEQVEAFVGDPSDEAYRKLVD